MVLDLIWVAGIVLSILAFLYGAFLVLMETGPFLHLSGKKSAAPLSLSPNELRLIEGLAKCGPDGHSHSGNGVMDTQHQGLFDDTNDLRAAILSGRPVDEVGATIDTLIRNVARHFESEEAILVAADYPGTAKHAALHRGLVDTAVSLIGRFRAGSLGIGELFRFLARDMLAMHALEADREFVSFLDSVRT